MVEGKPKRSWYISKGVKVPDMAMMVWLSSAKGLRRMEGSRQL